MQKGPLRGLRRTLHLCTICIWGPLCTVFGHIQELDIFRLGPHDFFRGRPPGGPGGKHANIGGDRSGSFLKHRGRVRGISLLLIRFNTLDNLTTHAILLNFFIKQFLHA